MLFWTMISFTNILPAMFVSSFQNVSILSRLRKLDTITQWKDKREILYLGMVGHISSYSQALRICLFNWLILFCFFHSICHLNYLRKNTFFHCLTKYSSNFPSEILTEKTEAIHCRQCDHRKWVFHYVNYFWQKEEKRRPFQQPRLSVYKICSGTLVNWLLWI